MTDQTKWGLDMTIAENKARTYEEQKSMRDELAFFVLNCSEFNMQELYSEMKRMKRRNEEKTIRSGND
tara:strand:+ start:3004 stop:3207 length:204 start_codon:yes stop_codon:yes gene_type:complete